MMRAIFSFALLFSMLSIKAQTYNIDQLIGGKWMLLSVTGELLNYETLEFYSKNIKDTFNGVDEYCETSLLKYYLSPTVPTKFDFIKVGTKTSGKYIVIYIDEFKDFDYLEIKSLSKDCMTLYENANLEDESLREDICYRKFKRVK